MKTFRKITFFTAAALLLLALYLVLRTPRPARPAGEPAASNPSTAEHPAAVNPRSRSSVGDRIVQGEADRLLKSEGVTTDIALTTFPTRDYRRIEPPAVKPAGATSGVAYIHVPSAGIRVAHQSNQIGEFPTVETRLNDTVGVRLQLPDVKPGTPVRVVILDGGSFPVSPGEVAQVLEAAAWRGVAFEFTTSGNIGTHRILVQAQGQPSRILDFTAIEIQGS
jgi:hypothetical protein